jgi:alginate O-acetyltransferase complex protein AlgI
MNFNSVEFLFFLFPVTLALYYAVPRQGRVQLLLLSSFIFYSWSGTLHLGFMLISILWGFVTAFLVEKRHTRTALWFCISLPLAILYLAKYLNFTLNSVGAGPEVRDFFITILSIALPAGISFYTFELVSYAIDIHDKKIEADRKLSRFALFVSFFPHLIAGPILRYHELRDQITRIATVEKINPDLVKAIKLLSIGLFAKIFFSDVPLSFHDLFKPQAGTSSIDAIYSVLIYSFILYYDFWAYSLMAIGLAEFFGIQLPRNFKEPYLSKSPREFWRRWHVTLSFWLRDYVYLKLGGNSKYVRNIAIVFVACGLWHGAGWNFIVWGTYHALLVIGYHYTAPWWDRLPNPVQIGLTFLLVTAGWPLFYLDLTTFWALIHRIFLLNFTPVVFGLRHWAYLGVVAAWTFLAREDTWLWNTKPRWPFDSAVIQAGMFFVAVVFFSYGRTFIYFRF